MVMNIKTMIVYEDDEMIILNKPAGVLSQSDKSFDVDLVSALLNYQKKTNKNPYIGIINRLDRPVSGLIVFAKDKKSAARLNASMQKEGFNKNYFALVAGTLPQQKGKLEDKLVKDAKSNISRVALMDEKDAKVAELEYEVLKSKEVENTVVTLVKIHLITGRHHQIRVQLSSRDAAILGDKKYCELDMSNIMRACGIKNNTIALCAYSLDISGKHFEVTPDFVNNF